jgi:hypothetical protein
MPEFLTPEAVGRTMKRARVLLATGTINRDALAVLDCLLFACRRPGQPSCRPSLSLLQRLTHAARGTVLGALRSLEAVGLPCCRRPRRDRRWRDIARGRAGRAARSTKRRRFGA